MISPQEFTVFAERYKAFGQDRTSPLNATAIEEFSTLQAACSAYQAGRAAAAKRQALEYNIFKVLRIESDEVRLHSAMLANLLDPRGSHGQGPRFLEVFWRIVSKDATTSVTKPLHFEVWKVSKEKFTINGNLDLVLDGREDGVLCVIENKIGAGEGHQQLQRYRQWLELHQTPHRLLYFLTIDGRASEQLRDETAYSRISYQKHITEWLEETVKTTEPVHLKETIGQYLEVVKHLEAST